MADVPLKLPTTVINTPVYAYCLQEQNTNSFVTRSSGFNNHRIGNVLRSLTNIYLLTSNEAELCKPQRFEHPMASG